MLFLWFFHACRRSSPRFLMVSDHVNYLTFEDPGAVNTVRRALKLAHAGDLYGAAETAGVDVAHAAVVSEGLRKGMRYSIGAEIDNDPRARPDAQNIVDAMRPDGMIRSVKFLTIDHPEKGGEYAWPFDNPEFAHFYDAVGTDRVWELYMARLLDDVEKLPGHIVGNFYRPAKFGHWPDEAKLEEYEDRLLDLVLARGMAVEIYTRPFYRDLPEEQRRRFIDANTRLIRKAKEKNVPIAIGSGAHSPKDQGGAFDVVLRMLDECDVNEIVFPVGGRLARVALRATKEHIEKQQKIQEPAQPGSSITGLSRAELGLPEEPERTPEELAATPKSGRDSGPKKRASSPARATKKPEPQEAPSKSSSRRSAESAASSAKAKENAAQAQEPAEEPAATDVSMEKPTPAKAKSATSKAAAKAPAVKPVNNAKPAVKEKAPPPKPAAKTDAKKTTVVKAPAKKAAASKTAAAKPAAKKLASKPAVKPAAKKPAVKKAAAATKKAPAKKTAPKVAPKAKKVASKNGAKKPAAKKTATATRSVKKTSKPSSTKGTTTKKKSTTKRR